MFATMSARMTPAAARLPMLLAPRRKTKSSPRIQRRCRCHRTKRRQRADKSTPLSVTCRTGRRCWELYDAELRNARWPSAIPCLSHRAYESPTGRRRPGPIPLVPNSTGAASGETIAWSVARFRLTAHFPQVCVFTCSLWNSDSGILATATSVVELRRPVSFAPLLRKVEPVGPSASQPPAFFVLPPAEKQSPHSNAKEAAAPQSVLPRVQRKLQALAIRLHCDTGCFSRPGQKPPAHPPDDLKQFEVFPWSCRY